MAAKLSRRSGKGLPTHPLSAPSLASRALLHIASGDGRGAVGQLITTMMAIQGDMGGGLGGTGGAVRNAAADAMESGVARAATSGSGLTVGEQIGILRSAATGKGNVALGEATAAESNALGLDWVWSGYRVSQTDGTTLISADGLRQYRPPASKSSSYATTGVQANFQSRSVPSGAWQDNGHLNITGQ